MTATKARKAKPKAKPKARALSARTSTGDPEGGSRGMLFLPQRSAGVVVNEDTGLTQSTVWACIRVVSETLAGMPWLTGRKLRDGTIEPEERADFDWQMNYQPNPETQSFAFRETLWAWALGWGNGYAEIERNPYSGDSTALWQLHPSRVRLVRTRGGRLLYEVLNDRQPPTYLEQRDVFHLMGPSPDGLVGWSVIRMHARTIGLAIAQEENAANFNANDSTPGGLLEHPGKLSEPARKNLEESWNRRHRGPNNRRTVAILEDGLKWTQTGIDPEDSKLVEQMQLTPSMICRIFGVPPHMVADLTRATFSNIENQGLDFVKNCLRPWAERGEAEADIKLFGRNNQAKLVTFIDLSERERGDTAAQTQHVERMLFCGVYTINMALKYLGKPGIGPMGDKRYIQSAMVPLEDAGKVDAPRPAPAAEEPDEPMAEDQLSRLKAGCFAVLTDACRRILMRESNDTRKLEGEALEKWLAKHREYCREVLMPAAALLAVCVGAKSEAIEVAVSLFLDKHLADRDGTPEGKAAQIESYLTAANAAGEIKCLQ